LTVKTKSSAFYYLGQPVRAIQDDGIEIFGVGTEGGGLVLFDRKLGKIAAKVYNR
jgi:hypothetical protein